MKPTKSKKVKKAIKTIEFWNKVLLSSFLMNDPLDRLEMLDAINVLKKKNK